MQQVVLHPALVLAPQPVALCSQNARGHIVHKASVMADQKNSSVVLKEQAFEQLKGVDVEVIGGLIKHQEVGRSREQTGQQESVSLAAREAADWRSCPFGRKQEVAQVAFHVLAHPVDFHPLAARADGVGQAALEREPLAHLVEVGHGEPRAQLHTSSIGLELTQQELE